MTRLLLVTMLLVGCSQADPPRTTDPLQALAQCVRDAGLADATNVDSEEAKEHMRHFCPELVAP